MRAKTKNKKKSTRRLPLGKGQYAPPLHPVWRFFKYDPQCDRAFCQVTTRNAVCRIGIKGRKSTNLKVHLRSAHPRTFFQHIFPYDASRSEAKLASPQSQLQEQLHPPQPQEPAVPETNNSSGSMSVSFTEASSSFNNDQQILSSAKWPIFSREHIQRSEAMFAFLLEADLPASIVRKPAFKQFVQTLDPKFQLPGTPQYPPEQTASISILNSCSTSELNSYSIHAHSAAQFTSYNNSEIVLKYE